MIVKWASVEENSEMAIWNLKKGRKSAEREVCLLGEWVSLITLSHGVVCHPHFWITRLFQFHFSHSSKEGFLWFGRWIHTALRHTGYSSNSVEMNGVFFKNQCTQRYDLEDQSSTFSRSFQIHLPVCRLCQHIHLNPYHIQARRSDLAYLILKSNHVAAGQRYKETQPVWTPRIHFHPHKQSVTQLSSTAPSSSISLWRLLLSWKR